MSKVYSFRYQVTTHGRFMKWFMMSLFENLLPPLHNANTLQIKVTTYRAWQSRKCLLKLTSPNFSTMYYYKTDPYIIYKKTSSSRESEI